MESVRLLFSLGYNTDDNSDELRLEAILQAGLADRAYRLVVQWLAHQIRQYGEIDEDVSSVDDLQCFSFELSSFLKELSCPYKDMLERPLSERFRQQCDALMLVDYLAGELAAHLLLNKIRKAKDTRQSNVLRSEPNASENLFRIFKVLHIDNPNASKNHIFEKINEKLDNNPNTINSELLFTPEENLTIEQWKQVDELNVELLEDRHVRLKMMLTRLDLTVSCFKWKKEYAADVDRMYRQKKRILLGLAESMFDGDISCLLAADKSLLIQERISSSRLRGSGKNMFRGYLTLPEREGKVNISCEPIMPMWSSREEGHADENLRKKHPKPPSKTIPPSANSNASRKSKKIERNCDVISGSKNDLEE
ncbi:protein FAM98B-like [Topomyia yanbarensis]|uniref:protein FAM98B-like n=1 Tax=Topomyia yanbarensis TaxID=2498891 RepID=UPI00273C184D|nr:protein FAM98B-like [Topomyia yanbarensis]